MAQTLLPAALTMHTFPFRITGLSSRLGPLVPIREWATRMGVTSLLDIESKSWAPDTFCDFSTLAKVAGTAIESAGVAARDIDLVITVSSTPYEASFDHDPMRLMRLLTIPDDVAPTHVHASGAGLMRAMAMATQARARRALIVAYNVPSLSTGSDAISADGAATIVLEHCGDTSGCYTYTRDTRSFGKAPLAEYFLRGMLLNHAWMLDARPLYLNEIARLYTHEATRALVKPFLAISEIPSALVPVRIERYGDLGSAAALRVLHEDLVSKAVASGDEIAMSFVGAGPERGALMCRVNVKNVPPCE